MKNNYNEFRPLLVHGVEMEKKIADGNVKQLNAAIKSGCRNIKLSDLSADPLFGDMLGLLGVGKRNCLRHIKYSETFGHREAKERFEMYEDALGYEIHLAHIAAHTAKAIHKGQVDKPGKDCFEGHLATAGGGGGDDDEAV